jgi:hypothetical protein
MTLVQIIEKETSPRPAPALPALLYTLLHTTTLHIRLDMDLSPATVNSAHTCASWR